MMMPRKIGQKYPSSTKKPTQKQLAALARGRAKRKKNIREKKRKR